MKRRGIVIVGLMAMLATACNTDRGSGANPASPSSLASLLTGSLRSASGGPLPSAEACGDFRWSVSEVTAGTYSGDFSAACADGVQLKGTATGTLVGDVLIITASGTATPEGLPACTFTLSGAARLVGETVQVDYTGTTCLGPVGGTEILTSS